MIDVIRKPDMTKNISTPTKPPGSQLGDGKNGDGTKSIYISAIIQIGGMTQLDRGMLTRILEFSE